MRLLIDCTPLHSGGGVQVAIAFLHGLRDCRDVTWLAVAPTALAGALPEPGRGTGRIAFVPKSSPTDMLKARFALQRFERDFEPDAVFTVFGPAYFRPRAPHLVGFALPHMIYEADEVPARARKWNWLSDEVRAALLRKADRMVVETETVRARLATRIGYDIERISVIGNCVNPLLLRHTPRPVSASGSFGILIPSAYYPHKNLEIVPAVAAALRSELPGLDFEFRLTLDPSSPEWQAIARDAASRGVSGRVTTLGTLSLDKLAEAYQRTSAVFLPTLREASTAVYPESFHFRRPLVTSDLDFARELCGDAARFAPPLAPAAIASAIAALARNPQAGERLVASGTRRLESCYPTADAKFSQQIGLLQSLSARSSGMHRPAERRSRWRFGRKKPTGSEPAQGARSRSRSERSYEDA